MDLCKISTSLSFNLQRLTFCFADPLSMSFSFCAVFSCTCLPSNHSEIFCLVILQFFHFAKSLNPPTFFACGLCSFSVLQFNTVTLKYLFKSWLSMEGHSLSKECSHQEVSGKMEGCWNFWWPGFFPDLSVLPSVRCFQFDDTNLVWGGYCFQFDDTYLVWGG